MDTISVTIEELLPVVASFEKDPDFPVKCQRRAVKKT
jgi:hypothetical protein